MKRLNGWQGNALRVWGLMALLAMAVFFLTRAVLLAHSVVSSQQPLSGLLSALALGSLRDMPVVAMIAAPWALFELLFNAKWRNRLRWPLFALYVFTLFFVAISEAIFWDEFSVRFNFIALDYLVFTTEVIGNIRQSYPVGKIIAALLALTLLVVWLLRRPIQRAGLVESSRMGQLPWVAAMMLGFGVLAYQQLAPEFSSNSFANELADNGWRSFLSAARQNRLDYRQFYASRPDAEVMADLQRLSGQGRIRVSRPPLQAVAYQPAIQTAHQPNRQPTRQPNVVVVMMESMSAEFMETFGNKQRITPNLDRLAKEGMLFANLYATGTRTVRGLEALSAALPPQPGAAVVRWPNIRNLNTLGSTLAERGWTPHFIYGGYGMFDNMNSYFASQSYQVTDRRAFKDGLVKFENVWGVADEHLFDQVLIEMDKDAANGKPFFMHVMTTSNHRPFTYPDGRIDIPSPAKREGGVKYADYAIGRFIEQAKQKPWFDNTIFLFVADHCAASAGKSKIPVYRYHIPAIVYAPKIISPQRVDTLASQIDLAPTLLGMLGLTADEHFVGRDILSMAPEDGRALLSTYQNLGYLKGDVMTVLQPKRKIETFRISDNGQEAQLIANDPKLTNEAIAYFQGAALLMERHGQDGSRR